MIKIKAIRNSKNCLMPEYVPENIFSTLSDDNYFYFAETKEEAEAMLPKIDSVIEDPSNKVNLIDILANATHEEIEFIKQVLR